MKELGRLDMTRLNIRKSNTLKFKLGRVNKSRIHILLFYVYILYICYNCRLYSITVFVFVQVLVLFVFYLYVM